MNNTIHDHKYRQQALATAQSFIVQAPAGSGKTELLIQRYLALLSEVDQPEEILAITFTKKAANEMRMRIISALQSAASTEEPAAAHAKQTWHLARRALRKDETCRWNLLNNPSQLRIQTIDALCAYLTRQLPLLSRFGAQPEMSDHLAILYESAVEEILSHLEGNDEWSQALTRLLIHLDNDIHKLHDLLIHLLKKRDQWLQYIKFSQQDAQIRRHLELQLSAVIHDALYTIDSLLSEEIKKELLQIARFAADHLPSDSQHSLMIFQGLTEFPKEIKNKRSVWNAIFHLLFTKSLSWRKRFDSEMGFKALATFKNPQEKTLQTAYRERLKTLIEQLQDREDIRLALTELHFLPDATYSDDQWHILQALLQVLKILAAQLRLTFQQAGQIDFIENTQAALLALGSDDDPTDLALILDYQIKHILIDEFQDTSFTQFQLLNKLIAGWETDDGRTLFIVGDPMQSIYRFREAEVGLFMRLCRYGIKQLKLHPLVLSVNFRSDAKLVDWNNTHFCKIFPEFNNLQTGAVSYSPSVACHLETQAHLENIHIKGFIHTETDAQANYLAQYIQDIKKQRPEDNIAILVRSRTHLLDILPALKKAKIPYSAIEIEPLSERQCIQDLLALSCALLHPADRIAWLSVLRAPWCGLSLADLNELAQDPKYTILELLQKGKFSNLTEDGQYRLQRVTTLLLRQIVERNRSDLRTWIENTWLMIGGPGTLNHDYELADVQSFFELLQNYSQTHLVMNIDRLKSFMDKLYAAGQQEDKSLQIMTIHAAKGLEFDTVIIPHLESKNSNDEKALLSWMEWPLLNEQSALLLAPIYAIGSKHKDKLYEYIVRQQRTKLYYEADRLFYVATTRAKSRLCLLFDVKQKEDETYQINSGSFLAKLWPFIQNNINEYIVERVISESTPTLIRQLKRLSRQWTNSFPLPAAEPVLHAQQSGFKLTNKQPALIGTLLHKILQQLAIVGSHWWTEKTDLEQSNFIHFHLKQLGCIHNLLPESIDKVQCAIQHTLKDERGRWILKAHSAAEAELALSAHIDGQANHLIVDRTFIDEHGTRWIIDYKTSTFTHADLETFLQHEYEKYAQQLEHYAEVMALHEGDRPIRLGLYFPALPAWKEWGFRN